MIHGIHEVLDSLFIRGLSVAWKLSQRSFQTALNPLMDEYFIDPGEHHPSHEEMEEVTLNLSLAYRFNNDDEA